MIRRLDGNWRIACDPDNTGRDSRWFEKAPDDTRPAPVPGIIQQVFPGYHGVAWYWHAFLLHQLSRPAERVLVRFGAVDYLAEVWVNGRRAGQFEGGETPFEFDVTDSVRSGGENLLAVRVLNPTDQPIDGYILDQVPHRNKMMKYFSGASFNTGGIMYPVELVTVPSIRIMDPFLKPDSATGRIAIQGKVFNHKDTAADVCVNVEVAEASGEGRELTAQRQTLRAAPGETLFALDIVVTRPRLWDLDDPFLYRVTIRVEAQGHAAHRRSVRCGFRDFRLVDGFFHLNGRRIFLKCSHTGNHVPIGQQVPVIRDHVRRDVINAKAGGFNALRFIAGTAWPDQLDFCDEMGILVFESTYAGWLLGCESHKGKAALPYGPVIEERYDHSVTQMVLRDRNHACLAGWELLNETEDGPVFKHAVEFLPMLRKFDDTRLVFLNSGRFDRRFEIGSCGNPGSDRWEHVWGAEAPDAVAPAERGNPSRKGAGDFHLYPSFPQPASASAYIRKLGHGTKPVFLSEYGMGSLQDVISELRHYEQAGVRPDLEDAAWCRSQAERLCADWKRLGLEGVYPFVEDMLRDSQRLCARQRTMGFDLIRSNPRICGYNLTGLLDHGMSGEGLWRFWREWKPGMFDAVADGWAPLRWCMFAEPLHAYAGGEIAIEAVLANEGVLRPGAYPVRLRLLGPEGCVWEHATTLTVPERSPLALPVYAGKVRVDGPEGRYTLAANLESGGAPSGGRLSIQITDPGRMPRLSGQVEAWGLDERVTRWLIARGLTCMPFDADSRGGTILVGKPGDAPDEARWTALLRRMEQGAAVAFLDPALFKDQEPVFRRLPLAEGKCVGSWEFLYHRECVAQRHPVFAGLQAPGIMDADYYGQTIAGPMFIDMPTPATTLCAAFHTGHMSHPGGYRCSLMLAEYRHGAGRFVLNGFALLEHLDVQPAADRLLLNLIQFVESQPKRWPGETNT